MTRKASHVGTRSRKSASGPKSSRRSTANIDGVDVGREPELTEVDREIIDALTGFRDTLRDRSPLAATYTIRQVAEIAPPPRFTPEDVRKTREALGVSQPVFADFLGASASTVRSWEQGQKVPSPMARRLLGFIATDPTYWKTRFSSMIKPR